jgi:IS30 family transposase
VRHSPYLLVLPITNATSETVTNAVAHAFTELPTTMRNADWDRRVEMARPTEFTSATSIPVFFCDAHCPRQRGSNENNRLLRQSFPKRTDVSLHIDEIG